MPHFPLEVLYEDNHLLLVAKARAEGQTVREGCFFPIDLLTADAVATVSVTGIRWLSAIGPQPVTLPAAGLLNALMRAGLS